MSTSHDVGGRSVGEVSHLSRLLDSLRVLWRADRGATVALSGWTLAGTVLPVVNALVIARLVAAVAGSAGDGRRAFDAVTVPLTLTAVTLTLTLLHGPAGALLTGRARARMTTALQSDALGAVSAPSSTEHLDRPQVVNALARLDGRTGAYFPADVPVTAAGLVSTQASGILACVCIARFEPLIALLLVLIWTASRAAVLRVLTVRTRALELVTSRLREAAYFLAVATGMRDAKEVRLFAAEPLLTDRVRRAHHEAAELSAGSARPVRRRVLACSVAIVATYFGSVLAAVHELRNGSLDYPDFVEILILLAVAVSAGTVTGESISVRWMLASWPDVRAFGCAAGAQHRPAPRGQAGRPPSAGTDACAVEVRGVGYVAPAGRRTVLSDVSFSLAPGSVTALVGANGAGKTTLVGLLCGFRPPTTGEILLDDTSIQERTDDSWQREIALVQQTPVRYPMTAFDNIAVGAVEHRADRSGVLAVARAVGIDALVDSLPNGWETLLTPELPGGVDLSGGQWQRVALARALFAIRHGARLLILDEPTSALDAMAEAEFYDRILADRGDVTTLLVSHRHATVRRADQVVVLRDGEICESGAHDDLVSSGGEYASMFGHPAATPGATR